MNAESMEFIALIRCLDFERYKEFYYMIKGALVVAEKMTKNNIIQEVKK